MKLLYINGTYEGGSLLSTRELVKRLSPEDDVEVRLIRARMDPAVRSYIRRRMTNLAVKIGGREPKNFVERANRWWGRNPRQLNEGEWSSIAVENAAASFLRSWRPDVVVVSSVDRVAWRRIRQDTLAASTKCILYLREEALLPHLDLTDPPDAVLANSRGLVDSCAALGWQATFIPSVIDLSTCEVESERTTALLINPTPRYGFERAVELAESCPEIGFVLQESTRLTESELASVMAVCKRLPNLEYRPFATNVADVYRDARVLLCPYTDFLDSNRPRSVLEAQSNGIPVLGSARPGLIDAVGPGGILLPIDADTKDWQTALRDMFSATPTYADLVEKAGEHARRPEADPAAICESFVANLRPLLS